MLRHWRMPSGIPLFLATVLGLGLAAGCGSVRVASRDEEIISHRTRALLAEQAQYQRSLQQYDRAVADAEERDRSAADLRGQWSAPTAIEQARLADIEEELADLKRGVMTAEAIKNWEYDREHPEEARRRQRSLEQGALLP